jgi:hypothetical protein
MSHKFRKTTRLAYVALLALALTPMMAAAQDFSAVQSNGDLNLRGYGTFFIPGTTHPINTATANGGGFANFPVGGLSMINQMHVQFMLPRGKGNGKKHVPIAIVHGCCLSTKSWQTTPDGRMGWDEYFVRQGFDTYMIDQVSRARSGFDATKYNLVRTGQTPCTPDATTGPNGCSQLPPILIASDQFAWNVFRWGQTPCNVSPCSSTTLPHTDLKFPVNTIGVGAGSNLQFYNMVIPDMNYTLSAAGPPPAFPDPADPTAFYNTPGQMAVLAKEVGGAILMGHSESSPWPTRAALQPASGCYPWTSASACKVKGIIQIETGCFANLSPAAINTLKHIPILIVDGDYFTNPRPPASCVTMMNQINGAGGDMQYALLPALTPGSLYPGSPGPMPGIEHMMMIGTKNIEVANLLIGWASSRGL